MIRTPPEHNTENPPGQVTYRPKQGLYLRDIIKRIEGEEGTLKSNELEVIKNAARAADAKFDHYRAVSGNTLPTPIAGPSKALADLKQALLGLCEYAESYDPKHPLHQVVYSRDIRRIIKEHM